MSYRKDQKAARDHAAEQISTTEFVRRYREINPTIATAAEDLGRHFGEDIVHRMFAEKAQRARGKTPAGEERVYGLDFGRNTGFSEQGRYSFESMATGKSYTGRWYWHEDGQGWSEAPPYDWKADASSTETFRVLPDGTIDLHPSQWSVIA